MSVLLGMLLAVQNVPEVRTREFSIPARPFYFEPAVAPAVQLYFNCLIGATGDLSSDIVAVFEASIAQCAEVRREAMTRADELLGKEPGWSNQDLRLRSIEMTFSQIDVSHRDQARRLLEQVGDGPARRPQARMSGDAED